MVCTLYCCYPPESVVALLVDNSLLSLEPSSTSGMLGRLTRGILGRLTRLLEYIKYNGHSLVAAVTLDYTS